MARVHFATAPMRGGRTRALLLAPRLRLGMRSKTQRVIIHELLCRSDAESGEKKWIEVFEQGLSVFRAGEFKASRDYMTRTRELRGGSDGPSEFYLRKLTDLEANGHQGDWTGIVQLSEK
jgi:hypothetical protein